MIKKYKLESYVLLIIAFICGCYVGIRHDTQIIVKSIKTIEKYKDIDDCIIEENTCPYCGSDSVYNDYIEVEEAPIKCCKSCDNEWYIN